jgi:hypothetical protein
MNRQALVLGFLLLVAPTALQAQFNYTVNEDLTITITGYTGPGGNVTVPATINGVPVRAIGPQAFLTRALTGIVIPVGVTNIGVEAFWSCHALTNATLPEGLITIGQSAFLDCSALAEITIPSSVTDIGIQAFLECASLKTITVDPLNRVFSSADGVLFDKSQLTLIQFPEGKGGSYTAPNGVVNVADNAFFWSTNLTGIVLASGVTNIGGGAFMNCTSLTSITLPNSLTTIGLYAFYGCAALTNLTLPDGVTSIGRIAFGACTSLTTFTIPASVNSIDDGVFINCTGLESVTIANSVLGLSEFSGCTNLVSVSMPAWVNNIPDFAFEGCSRLRDIAIPAGVTNIGVIAFNGCASLARVTIPDKVTTIADGLIGWGLAGAFSGCTSLTNVVLGKGLTYIGAVTFLNCIGLTSITIPAGVTNIGEYVFTGCTNLVAVYFQGNAPSSLGAFAPYPFGPITPLPTVYYPHGTTGWGALYEGCRTMLWDPRVPTNDGSFGVRQNQFGFNIAGTPDIPLVIEASNDISARSWVALQRCTLTNGLIYFSDAQWTNYHGRFYRIRSP